MSTSKGKHRRSVADENAEDEEPCSSSSLPAQAHKRARFSSESAEQVWPFSGFNGQQRDSQVLTRTSVCRCPGSGIHSRSLDLAYPMLAGCQTTSCQTNQALLLGAMTRYNCLQLLHPTVALVAANTHRPHSQEGHYVYELGENISSRCKYDLSQRPSPAVGTSCAYANPNLLSTRRQNTQQVW